MKYQVTFKDGRKIIVQGKGIAKAFADYVNNNKLCDDDKIKEYAKLVESYIILRDIPTENITKEEYLNLSIEDRRLVENIYNDLSPENLTCDGELSRGLVRTRVSKIYKVLTKLQKRIGKVIPEEIVYDNLLPRDNKLRFHSWN